MYEYVYEYVKICTHFYIHRDSELQCNPRKNWEYVEEYAEIPEKKVAVHMFLSRNFMRSGDHQFIRNMDPQNCTDLRNMGERLSRE